MMSEQKLNALGQPVGRILLGCQTTGQCFCTGRCNRTAEEQARHEEYQRRNASFGRQEFEPKPGHGPAPDAAAPSWEYPGQFDPASESEAAAFPESTAASALNTQVGGDHYKKLEIQPMEYSMANGLDACQHTIVKYVTRFRDKGGVADLEKAKHCIDMLIEFEGRKS